MQGGFVGLYSLAARIYPTEFRNTGIGWSIGAGRLGAVVGPLAAGFLIAISVRIIQGSATVAMLTAAGLMGPVVQELAFSPSVLALMTIAIAAGATAMSHVNDTGFWIVNRYFDTDYMVVIGKKTDKKFKNYPGDNYKNVLNFFKLWNEVDKKLA